MRAAPILAIVIIGGSLHGKKMLRRGCCGRCEVPGQDQPEVRWRSGSAEEPGGGQRRLDRGAWWSGRGEAQANGTQEPTVRCKLRYTGEARSRGAADGQRG